MMAVYVNSLCTKPEHELFPLVIFVVVAAGASNTSVVFEVSGSITKI